MPHRLHDGEGVSRHGHLRSESILEAKWPMHELSGGSEGERNSPARATEAYWLKAEII
jgi:hypothetical protein